MTQSQRRLEWRGRMVLAIVFGLIVVVLMLYLVGVFGGRPVFVKDVARVEDAARELSSYAQSGSGADRWRHASRFFTSSNALSASER